ncbi:hypothetical protein ACNQP7_31905 [Mycolicibacterium fortuitum]|uniref:DUF7257 domain-containing protein n=1 Tax=Mycolicibacterium fortuitum TaxID=1766 RepID=UPI003AAFE2AF
MTDPIPEWLRQTPNLESLHNLPDVPWGGWNPREVPLPSLPELADIVQFFLDNFLGWVAKALGAIEILGWKPFEWLVAFGQALQGKFSNLAALFGITDADLDGDIDLQDVWTAVANTFLSGIFSIPADVQASINESLGHLQDALEGNYTGSGPIFLAVQALAEAWLKATDPLNAANLFGRISLPQFGSGVPIMALTTAVPNELEPFSAASVPTADGWSFNAGQDAAQVVADGSTKTLYLQSGVIKVESGQPLDTSVSVTYSGVTSGAGQTIRYVLETFTTDDGSGTATPVTVGAVTNPSGTITTPVSLGSSSWAIPAGVQSVRPVLECDELISAGTVFWKNTPSLKKKLAGPLSGGLPAAIQDRIDDFNGLLGDLLSNPAGVIGTITQGMVSGLTDLNTLTNQIRDILAGLVVTPINSTVQAIKDWFTGVVGKTQNLTSGGNLPPANVGSPTGGTNIGQDILDTLNGIWAGLRGAGSATGKTATDVNAATAATADLITQVSSTAARLDASVSQVIKGGGGGTNDQFEREDTDLGDDWDWTNVGAGAIATNGNSAYWATSGGSAASQVARNKTFETATNWQNASFVLTEPLNTTSGWMLCGRMNAARDTYVYMFVKKDYREIGYVASGTPHVLASSTDPYDPPPGTKVEGFFGHELFNEDTFWLAAPSMASGMTVPSTAPAKGPGYRNMGFGAKVVAVSGAQVSPGSLELWTGGDSQSPPTVGVYLEAERSVLSSPYATLSNGNLPSGFLTVTRQSDWISFDASTTTFTVELPGAYHVWATLSIDANLTTGNSVDLKTFGSGVEFQLYAPRLVPGGGIEQQLSGVLYLDSGDQIQLLCQLAGSATKKAVGSLRVAKLSPPYFA